MDKPKKRRKPRVFKGSRMAQQAILPNLGVSGPELRKLITQIAEETGNPRNAGLRFFRQLGIKAKQEKTGCIRGTTRSRHRQLPGASPSSAAEAVHWVDSVNMHSIAVQVIDPERVWYFDCLAAAQETFPELDPYRATTHFTFAMRGEINGAPAIRFETWAAYEIYCSDMD